MVLAVIAFALASSSLGARGNRRRRRDTRDVYVSERNFYRSLVSLWAIQSIWFPEPYRSNHEFRLCLINLNLKREMKKRLPKPSPNYYRWWAVTYSYRPYRANLSWYQGGWVCLGSYRISSLSVQSVNNADKRWETNSYPNTWWMWTVNGYESTTETARVTSLNVLPMEAFIRRSIVSLGLISLYAYSYWNATGL